MKHFNKLTPSEAERLAILAEECAEVIKVIGKILRHGYESIDPSGKEPGSNRDQLEAELGHVLAQAEDMDLRGDICSENSRDSYRNRLKKIDSGKYRHHK